MHPMRLTTHPLDALVYVIEQQSRLRAPDIDPYALAAVLGMTLRPSVGARYSLRGAVLTYDPSWTLETRMALIARGCAVYALGAAGLLSRSHQRDVHWLAQTLCGIDTSTLAVTELQPVAVAKG